MMKKCTSCGGTGKTGIPEYMTICSVCRGSCEDPAAVLARKQKIKEALSDISDDADPETVEQLAWLLERMAVFALRSPRKAA